MRTASRQNGAHQCAPCGPPAEAERQPADAPLPSPLHPTRPRRVWCPRPSLAFRREQTRDGYILHFTGREATSALMDEVFDELERLLGPG